MKNLDRKQSFNMNKSGLSDVVATVLLLLLTVAAIGVLSSILIPFVKDRLYGSTDCTRYENSFSFVEQIEEVNYNCYDLDFDHGLIVKSESIINENDQNLKGFQISFQSAGRSRAFEVNKTSGSREFWNLPYSSNGGHYYPNAGEIVSFAFDLSQSYTKAEIRAVLANGKICKASDSIEITNCARNLDFKTQEVTNHEEQPSTSLD